MATSNPRSIHAVLFDLDNTLLDRNEGFLRFCQELYRTRAAIRRTHTEVQAVTLMKAFDADGRPREEMLADFMSQWPGVFLGMDQAIRTYRNLYPRMMILDFPTRKLLGELKSNGIPIGVVTNGPTDLQRAKIRESGVEFHVDAYVISEELGISKPEPRIFVKALELIGANSDTTLFVGDNPEADILGAQALGMRTAWVRRGRQWPVADRQPDYEVDHVSEIGPLVLE